MKKVLKISVNDWKNASRDKRELSVIVELGGEVEVIAKGDITGKVECVDGYSVTRITARPLGDKIPVQINRIISIFTWAWHVRKKNADIISGHDFIALMIGYLSNFGKVNKAKLVYDSHEFELGRNVKRSKLRLWMIRVVEHFLIKKSVFSIMVNDSIAEEVVRIHNLKHKPIVVRNIPSYWILDRKESTKVRKQLLENLNNKSNAAEINYLLMYHGNIFENRGIEALIEVIERFSDVGLVILGNAASREYLERLKNVAMKFNVSEKVLFHPAVPIEVLKNYVSAADVGMINTNPVYRSYYYGLPNKFFECIQSCLPVIISDRPEIKKIVQKYNIGLICKPNDISSIERCIRKMRHDNDLYRGFKNNIKMAKEDLCWENEKKVLLEAYKNIM